MFLETKPIFGNIYPKKADISKNKTLRPRHGVMQLNQPRVEHMGAEQV